MGKKKILVQSEQDVLKEEQQMSAAQKKAVVEAEKMKTGRVEKGRIFIQSSYNNTIISVADAKGNIITWTSAGSLGFKGPKKATPFAASKAVEAVMEKIRRVGMKEVIIFVRGIGSGREAAIRALATHGLDITAIKDITPIPHNGCRPPKIRRV